MKEAKKAVVIGAGPLGLESDLGNETCWIRSYSS